MHRNTLQHTSTQCYRVNGDILHHNGDVCDVGCGALWTVHHAITYDVRVSLQHTATHGTTRQHTATPCNALQHPATHCNIRQHPATHCSTLQRTATHCNTLQHAATHCNTVLSSMVIFFIITAMYAILAVELFGFRSPDFLNFTAAIFSMYQVAVCCSVWQCVAVCGSVLQCVWQCVAACCSVL